MRISEYYNINKTQAFLDFVDVPLNTDIKVFINPSAINNMNSSWGNECISLIQHYFNLVLTNIKNKNNDKAINLLSALRERNEIHMGFSSGKSRGRGFGNESAKIIWNSLILSKAATTGLLKDLEDTCSMIKGIDRDMISDAVSNIIRGPLIKYTQDMCNYYGIKMYPQVESGPIWNIQKEIWENSLIQLPVTSYGKIILVPKYIVRLTATYDSEEYYRHYLLPEMERDEILNKTSLVTTLKSGKKIVSKKSLMEKYGAGKLAIVNQTIKRTHILEKYKSDKETKPLPPLSHEEFSEIGNLESIDWSKLISELVKIPSGKDTANLYENHIEDILTALFYPNLLYPKKQDKIHDGRKRIDITYTNESKEGFFYWVSSHYPSGLIFIECKNYGDEVGNPEIDQLAGRFSPSRGKVGFLICRKIKNKKLLLKRCKDTVSDDRGYIIPLDDDDIKKLIEDINIENNSFNFPLLRSKFNELIK